jgi:hypothetical protein
MGSNVNRWGWASAADGWVGRPAAAGVGGSAMSVPGETVAPSRTACQGLPFHRGCGAGWGPLLSSRPLQATTAGRRATGDPKPERRPPSGGRRSLCGPIRGRRAARPPPTARPAPPAQRPLPAPPQRPPNDPPRCRVPGGDAAISSRKRRSPTPASRSADAGGWRGVGPSRILFGPPRCSRGWRDPAWRGGSAFHPNA